MLLAAADGQCVGRAVDQGLVGAGLDDLGQGPDAVDVAERLGGVEDELVGSVADIVA